MAEAHVAHARCASQSASLPHRLLELSRSPSKTVEDRRGGDFAEVRCAQRDGQTDLAGPGVCVGGTEWLSGKPGVWGGRPGGAAWTSGSPQSETARLTSEGVSQRPFPGAPTGGAGPRRAGPARLGEESGTKGLQELRGPHRGCGGPQCLSRLPGYLAALPFLWGGPEVRTAGREAS